MNHPLLQQKILICVGSGGVGKTTISAAIGILAARAGLKVLVMTIDPSKRLKDSLGLGDSDDQPIKVPGQNYAGELYASLVNAEKIFFEFVQGSGDVESAKNLTKNRLYQQLSTTLSGTQEFTSLLQLSKVQSSHKFDLVILDTPPAQHAIDFLEAPEKISALFQENVVQWFVGDNKKLGFVKKVIYRGTRMVLGLLANVTGASFMEELHDFFTSVSGLQKSIDRKATEVADLLKSQDTKFLLVTGFDEGKLKEAEVLQNYLSGRNFQLKGILVNRDHPGWSAPTAAKLMGEYNKWEAFYLARSEKYDAYAKKWGQSLPVWRIPDFNEDLSGIRSLEVVANVLQK